MPLSKCKLESRAIVEAAAAAGVPYGTVRYRMNTKGMTLQEALEVKRGRPTLAQAAAAAGVDRGTVRYRMKVKGMTLQEAVNFKRKL